MPKGSDYFTCYHRFQRIDRHVSEQQQLTQSKKLPKSLKSCCEAQAALPFSEITNNELIDLITSDENVIKRKLYNHNFKDYLQTDIPDHSDITVCKYYSVEKYVENFNETRHNTSSGLKLLHINISSPDKHFNELISMINTLNDVDIIALSEIGKKSIKKREAQLMKMGYHFHYKEPTLARGGVGIIFNKRCKCLNVRDDLQFEGKDENDCKLETENIWIETE